MALNSAMTAIQHLFGALLRSEPDLPWTKKGPEKIGQKLVDMLEKGEYADLRSLLARRIRWLVSAKKLEQSWKSVIASQGKVIAVKVGEVSKNGDMTVVRFPLEFEKSAVSVVVRISGTGYLTSIRAIPDYSSTPWSPPGYVDEKFFAEEEVTLGVDDRAVPASLTVPHSAPQAAIILLQGSGPSDRNSSIGQLKPFKDLAWGLSSRGFAVMRFDKVTFVHAGKPIENPTLEDEYVYHAEAAIKLLREREATKNIPIYVLGHSLGGTVAPRVGKGDASVAGLIIMAGSAKPLHWTAIRQLQYMNTLKDKKYHVPKAMIDAATKQAKFIDSSNLTLSTPSSKLPFDIPASFWLDLRSYDAVATAAALGKPMLVLQGGRDYQVTVKDDFQAWKVGLKDQKDITCKVYVDKNHLFRSGKGLSSPEEYDVAGGHVDQDVVEDIAGWLTKQCRATTDVAQTEVKAPAETVKQVETTETAKTVDPVKTSASEEVEAAAGSSS